MAKGTRLCAIEEASTVLNAYCIAVKDDKGISDE